MELKSQLKNGIDPTPVVGDILIPREAGQLTSSCIVLSRVTCFQL